MRDERSAEVGGVRNTSTNAMLDGVDFSAANINNPAIALSLDVIEEFKVRMNFRDASYGHGAAAIDMVSRRGSNEFHGVVYDFIRNRAFQAGQFFRPARGAPRFSYNQFGASAGGAIKKDRTFYFGNYEGRRRRTGTILQGLVPTEEMTAQDLANVGTGGQRGNATGVKSRKLDPRTSGLLGLDRAAYSTPAGGTFGNLSRNTQPGFGINNWDFPAIKNFAIPWLGESSRLQFRFEWFNFFHHAQFLDPAPTVNVPATFGIVTQTLDPRILQIAGKLYW